MSRAIIALLVLVASTAASSAQGLLPAVWKGERGAILKVLGRDSAGFSGVFLSNPSGPCPVVPYDVAGSVRGHRVVFQTTRRWTADCRVTATWHGRMINPTTIATTFVATFVEPNGRRRTMRGSEVFHRI
jgi:hypothetical protein